MPNFLSRGIRLRPIPDTVEDEDTDEEENDENESREGEGWNILRHRGPWFESIDRKLTIDEVLEMYSRVPECYYGKTFWKNFHRHTRLTIPKDEVIEILRTLRAENSPRTSKHPHHDHTKCTIRYGGVSEEEKITNWKMEPPSIFLGRGDHPMRGCVRRRVVPEDVTLNLDKESPIPELPKGRQWKEIVHRPECSWLWSWTDPLLLKTKYVYTSTVSKEHAERERRKFDEAWELESHIEDIRKFYTESFLKGEYLELASVLYLIDRTGIRIGNDNNRAVDGATTLRVENINILDSRRTVRIRFIGKDCIEYVNNISCDPGFVRTIRKLSSGKTDSERLFPNVTPRIVNTYLQSFNPRLSAKTFRTFHASSMMRRKLSEYKPSDNITPSLWFKKCATEVAVFCNHKRTGISSVKAQPATSTTLTNYIDPRVVVEWAGIHNVPLTRLYSKKLVERFEWAFDRIKSMKNDS